MTTPPRRTLGQKIRKSFLYLLIVAVFSLIVWRQYRIWSIPDVEPFDREAFYSRYSEVNNNIESFREAHRMLSSVKQQPQYRQAVFDLFKYEEETGFGEIPPWMNYFTGYEQFSADCRPALEMWYSGGEAGEVLIAGPPQFDHRANSRLQSEAYEFVILTNLECSRLLEEGKPGEALELFLKMLRSLSRYRSIYSVQHGYRFFSGQLGQILSSPQLTADEIRDFQTELHELIPELTNLSLMVKSSQLMLEKELQNHLRKYRLDNLLTGEPEAAFRMLKLTTANWLEYCDQPADNLSHLRVHSCSGDSSNLIPYPLEKKVEMHGFDVGENRKCIICYFENPADEEDLIDHFHSLYYSRLFLSQYFSEMNLRLLAKQDLLHMVEIDEVRLALHGFYREQGRFPDKLNELVPGWFTETPDFYLEHYQGDAYHLLRTVEGGLHSGRYGSTITKPKEQE